MGHVRTTWHAARTSSAKNSIDRKTIPLSLRSMLDGRDRVDAMRCWRDGCEVVIAFEATYGSRACSVTSSSEATGMIF
jgi:hypothetical protein